MIKDVLDIGPSVINCRNIIPSVLSAHALSGCDTVAPFFGLGKTNIVNKLRNGKELKSLGDLEASTEDILVESALLISSCYGFESKDMTECRINSWYRRTSKARKTAPPLCTLLPTHETFSENVKRAHFQSAVSLSAMSQNPPNLYPTKYRWEQDEINEVLCLIGIPFCSTT